jgi:hypothetical protein
MHADLIETKQTRMQVSGEIKSAEIKLTFVLNETVENTIPRADAGAPNALGRASAAATARC